VTVVRIPENSLLGGAFAMLAAIGLGGCVHAYFDAPITAIDEHVYTSIYPYYAEYCAESEFDKKKGFGVDIDSGGPGGHSVFYLNGACRVPDAGYPVLALCDESQGSMAGRGVGLSVNDHYRNANWIATEGRDFFFRGDLHPGEAVTRANYVRTQDKAKAMGILDGIEFHREALEDKPEAMTLRDFMYEVSIASDYAVDFARDRYCARVPLDRGKMDTIVHYLNALNEPYRSGQKEFHWNVLRNNCAYLAHDALAVVGVWPELPMDRPLLVAAFDFPVPKNEFVNLIRRTNDMLIDDPDALYDDATARSTLLHQGWIVTQPGALAEAQRVVMPNEVYGTHLRLIFYDEAMFGHYQPRFETIFREPRYTDLAANLTYFSALYTRILATRTLETNSHHAFNQAYYDAITRERQRVDAAFSFVRP
jgi:hypothetical protein